MPIRREHSFFYPIDWPQLSAVISFRRAKGRCESCGRPHGHIIWHLGDGRWWDAQA
ncbi:HNH endonuclease, partial [Methylobacterium sp. J-067]|nr:HNH endonuclease [Methylobacterium sp. J-067]